MKLNKWMYWIITGLLSLAFLLSSWMYLSGNPELVANFEHFGFPIFMLQILGVAKLLGALALINTKWPKLREWAYAGYVIVLIGAIWTHLATGTPFVAPLIFLILVSISYIFNLRYHSDKVIS